MSYHNMSLTRQSKVVDHTQSPADFLRAKFHVLVGRCYQVQLINEAYFAYAFYHRNKALHDAGLVMEGTSCESNTARRN